MIGYMIFLALIVAASAYAPDTPQPLLGDSEIGAINESEALPNSLAIGDLNASQTPPNNPEISTLNTHQTPQDDLEVGVLSMEMESNDTATPESYCSNTIQNCKDGLVTLLLMLVSSYSLTALSDGTYSAGALLQTHDFDIKPELQQMITKIHESPNETLQELLWLELPYQLTVIKLTPYFVYECYKITTCLLYACQTYCNCASDKQGPSVKKTRATLCRLSALIGGLAINIQRNPTHYTNALQGAMITLPLVLQCCKRKTLEISDHTLSVFLAIDYLRAFASLELLKIQKLPRCIIPDNVNTDIIANNVACITIAMYLAWYIKNCYGQHVAIQTERNIPV